MREKLKELSPRKTAVTAGILFLLGYVGVFLGSAFYSSVLEGPGYLSVLYAERNQVIIGMLIELINDTAVIGIGVVLFPILRKHSERIALAYLVFRVIEGILLVISKIGVLSLIPVSKDFIAADAPAASYFQGLGSLALAGRLWAAKMQTVFFIGGALMLYYILYRSKLVPRIISLWGFIASAALILANVLGIPDPTQGFRPAVLLYFPIIISELLIAVWLIVKGFNHTAGQHASAPVTA